MVLGLYVLGVFRVSIFERTLIWHLGNQFEKRKRLRAFLVGVTLGFAWTPCIGPVLAVILFWSSQLATFWQGFFLLLAYGLGLAIPFLILSVFIDFGSSYLARLRKFGQVLNMLAGVLIVIIGLLLIADKFGFLINYTLRLQEVF